MRLLFGISERILSQTNQTGTGLIAGLLKHNFKKLTVRLICWNGLKQIIKESKQ